MQGGHPSAKVPRFNGCFQSIADMAGPCPRPPLSRLTHGVISLPSIDALQNVHSITSSAVARSGNAVLRLITSSLPARAESVRV